MLSIRLSLKSNSERYIDAILVTVISREDENENCQRLGVRLSKRDLVTYQGSANILHISFDAV